VDGTIQLHSSLAGLAGLGIDHMIDDGQGLHVDVVGGLGDQSLSLISGKLSTPAFDQDLNVTVQLHSADANLDGHGNDNIIQINTSLSELHASGIDQLNGDAGAVVDVTGGLGDVTLSIINNVFSDAVHFASQLDVTAHVIPADLVAAGGWNALAPALSEAGIDHVSVGIADISLSDVSALISAGLDFVAIDNIGLIDPNVANPVAMDDNHITLDQLGSLGVDTVDAHVATPDVIALHAGGGVIETGMTDAGLESALQDILAKFDAPVFDSNDEVTIDVGHNVLANLSADVLNEIQLLGIDYLDGIIGGTDQLDHHKIG
jgi:hypothetical protein